MSLVSLAKTTFSSGPDDALIVLDVYKKSDSNPVNSVKDTNIADSLQQSIESVAKVEKKVKDILDTVKNNDLVKNLTSINTIDRLIGQTPALNSFYQDLSSVAKNALSIENKLKDVAEFKFDSKTAKILVSGLKDAKAIAGLVNNISNGKFSGVFKDYGAISGIVTSLTKQAVSTGLSGVFKTLSKDITDKNALVCSAQDLLPDVVKTGNTDLFMEIANSSIGKEIKSIFPNAVGSIIKDLKIPTGLKQQDYSSYYKNLSDSFKIVDAGWNIYKRGNGALSKTVLNGVKVGASKAFIDLLKSSVFSKTKPPTVFASTGQVGFPGPIDPETASINELADYETNNDKFLLMMKQYQVKSVPDELKQMLPTVNITPDPIHENLDVIIT